MARVLNIRAMLPHDLLPAPNIYIGRGSKWGNPFKVGRDGTREQVIAMYDHYLQSRPELLASLHELRGMDLLCYCAPLPCHGHVLVKLANTVRVLVCGGKAYHDTQHVNATLNRLHMQYGFGTLIEGEAPGADTLARKWAEWRNVPVEPYPAQWDNFFIRPVAIRKRADGTYYNAAAGPARNQQMLAKGKPDIVVAFKGDRGTADMTQRSRLAGKQVILVEERK